MSHAEGPSRRTLLGAAWSAPVIALAVAAPTASASGATLRISVSYSTTWNASRLRYTVRPILSNPAAAVTASLSSDDFVGATYRSGWSYSIGIFSYPLAAGGSSPANGLELLYDLPAGSQPGEVFIVELLVTAPGFAVTVVPVPLVHPS